MLGVVVLAAAIWFGGAAMRVPTRVRWVVLGLLYLAILGALFLQPQTLGVRLGGSAGEWLVLGGLGLAIWAYMRGLRWLRGRAGGAKEAVKGAGKPGAFSASELNRYARHIILHEIGGLGQKRLRDARVLVIGAGGLGAPVLQYLAAAGVGTIGVVDGDVVDSSNLQRQVIHKDQAIGMPKVHSAAAEMRAQNPFVTVRPYHRRLDQATAAALFADYDLVLDGTDNFDTRYLVNAAAVAARIPLVSGALSQWEGQVAVFDPAHGAPCYACVFPSPPAPGLVPSCAEAGVLAPLPGVIGSMMAAEAVKIIAGAGKPLAGRMLIYDALYAESRIMTLHRREDCQVCAGTIG